MRTLLAVLLFCFAGSANAACLDLPKLGMAVSEVLVAAVPNAATGRPSLVAAWPTVNPDRICCTRIQWGGAYWGEMLNLQVALGATPAPLWLAALPVRDNPTTIEEAAMCQTMANAIIVVMRVVRNTQRADGARPLKVLRDPALPLSGTNPLIDLKVGSAIQYVEAGRPCERTPIINTTSAGQWLYTTSNAGQRGIALCK